jgi:hypothetical protein
MGRIMRLGSEKLRSRASVALAIPQAVVSATCVCRTELRTIEKAVPGCLSGSEFSRAVVSGGLGVVQTGCTDLCCVFCVLIPTPYQSSNQ